ncbi:MAG: hypothetical protein SGI72_02420 [Planctomycetota bacterium]|nr:hypothetical protein [Planctomycetota bacterium]
MQARPERFEAARVALERARVLAPDWIAPQRLLDEIERQRLRGVDVLRDHRAALARDASDAGRLYLAGRLEGKAGTKRFEAATHYAPDLAWGWHGASFAAASAGDMKSAVSHARRALALAIDPYERTFFQATLARQLAAAGDSDAAVRLLEECAARKGISERARTALLVPLVEIGLEGRGNRSRERAYETGLAILRERDLTDTDVESLASRMKLALYTDDIGSQQLALALAAQPGATRERLRAEIAPSAVGRAVLERATRLSGRPNAAGARARAARFAAFEFRSALEQWRASLPKVVVDADGMPRDPRLLRIVEKSLELPDEIDGRATEPLIAFGDALIQAGWFKEARSVAARLAVFDLERALTLENRAQAGLAILDGLERVARRSDRNSGIVSPNERGESEASRRVRTLDDFLVALAPLFARSQIFLGGETDANRVARIALESPRMRYAGVAELVHPGPLFSHDDERDEIGIAGKPVGGIARLFLAIGRFAILGQVSGGGGPDACVLPLLWCEERSGEHLGVPWHGTIAWCEAADLKSRAGRSGAMISAAALHEGYWVDVDAVRDEHAAWIALRRRFSQENGVSAADVQVILASGGLELSPRAVENERRSTVALLGEANRVRLAVLADRASESGELGSVSLDELLEVTTIHEEGHLCDRERFLPLFDNKLAILRLFVQCHFSPQRVNEELEYRAQLIALCASPDPRIALAQVIDAAEGTTSSSLTPHSAGYKRLLDDLLIVLDEQIRVDPPAVPSIDPARTLAHQCHRLSGEEIRRLSRLLASRKRM